MPEQGEGFFDVPTLMEKDLLLLVRASHPLLLRRRKTRSGLRRASRSNPRRVDDTPPVEPLALLARSRLTTPRHEVGEKCGPSSTVLSTPDDARVDNTRVGG